MEGPTLRLWMSRIIAMWVLNILRSRSRLAMRVIMEERAEASVGLRVGSSGGGIGGNSVAGSILLNI